MINDSQMIRNNFENSSSFLSDEEFYALDGIKTRIVWVTNYMNNEDFPINVPANDPLIHIIHNSSNTIEVESSLLNKIHNLDLSKLNLDDLLLLLYRLQQQTTKNSVTPSASTISSSSSSSSLERKPSSQKSTLHSLTSTFSHSDQSAISMHNEIPNRRQSSFTLSNIADVPKQLTTTLSKPISSFHSQYSTHIHSPNDVVNKLLQSFNLQKPSYTYQESQHHKAKLISNLLSNGKYSYQKNFYH